MRQHPEVKTTEHNRNSLLIHHPGTTTVNVDL